MDISDAAPTIAVDHTDVLAFLPKHAGNLMVSPAHTFKDRLFLVDLNMPAVLGNTLATDVRRDIEKNGHDRA